MSRAPRRKKGTAPAGKSTPPKQKLVKPPQTVAELRRAWIDFFTQKHGHIELPSASLFPAGDPTLLFTSAGMVPFKSYFAGTEKPPAGRVVTIQKCLRTTDLESVGKTERHCSFFEMLGNFSFGNYFKKEAIQMAWQFSLEVLQFDAKKIHVTVYKDDPEAAELWLTTTGIPPERLTYLGADTNWWGPAGDSGPCGPCTELYLDRGIERCTCQNKSLCAPGGECDRFMEYWNLVFNQYHKSVDGILSDLPQQGVDTGAGLERIAALLAGKDSVYETDELIQIQQAVADLAGITEKGQDLPHEQRIGLRVLADHLRASSFAIADGIAPGNQGRNYVIRRIIRRALMFARDLNITGTALYRLVPEIIRLYGTFYPELKKNQSLITERIQAEEERFLKTLSQGLVIFEEFLEHVEGKVFPGHSIFTLYDTFGFPVELTLEMLERRGLKGDLAEFERSMDQQRARAQSTEHWKDIALPADLSQLQSEFCGYDQTSVESRLEGIVRDGQSTEHLRTGDEGLLILNNTPFYAEGGGQQGDTGEISTSTGLFRVLDTQKKGSVILHRGICESGSFEVGTRVKATVAADRRQSLTWHHSATHLLNAALRRTLGDGILQTGSLVAPDYLRFDFSHGNRLSEVELEAVEADVLEAIARNEKVTTQVMPLDAARQAGALATFGEKYGQEVRVVRMGKEAPLSIELCGGCHVNQTGDIQLFYITKESSPGAGNRRIEARAGSHALLAILERRKKAAEEITALKNRIEELQQAGAGGDPGGLANRLKAVMLPEESGMRKQLKDPLAVGALRKVLGTAEDTITRTQKELQRLEKQTARATSDVESILSLIQSNALQVGSLTIFRQRFEAREVPWLRSLGDQLKRTGPAVVLFGNSTAGKVQLLYMANPAALALGVDCRALITATAALIEGSGGGKPDLAQAGGKSDEKLDTALETAFALARKQTGA